MLKQYSVTFPALKDNRGQFTLQSSEDISSSCATFKALQGSNNVIKGEYVCAGTVSDLGSIESTPSGTSLSTGSSSTSSSGSGSKSGFGVGSTGGGSLSFGAKAGIGIAIALLVIVALGAWLFFRRRRKTANTKEPLEHAGTPELSSEERKPYEADSQEIYEAGMGERTRPQSIVAELPGHQTSPSRTRTETNGLQRGGHRAGISGNAQSGSRRRHEADSREIGRTVSPTIGQDPPHSTGDRATEVETVSTAEETQPPQTIQSLSRSKQPIGESSKTQPPASATTTDTSNVVPSDKEQIAKSSRVDSELERLHQEMALIHEEREREERLRALRSRELELRRAIEQRERDEKPS
jgi:hypothetical protein